MIGDNDERFGPRFPDMSEPYSIQLREKAEQVADQLAIPYRHGVYTLFQGPYYETAAEIRMYARAGSDAIGMSTVPERQIISVSVCWELHVSPTWQPVLRRKSIHMKRL